jgi:hypothetical protein
MIASLLMTGKILEAAMLICFGCSWPISIFKSWRTKFVQGKSLGFMYLIFTGYIVGIAHKFARAASDGEAPEWTTVLYALNAILVGIDVALYFRYRHNHEPVSAELASQIAELTGKK